ncbi:MAG: hypothetical protein EOP38_16905 [Rubrivivax sp.]|nr:MAG: hypothetical protein EOP38_16905 [Rubrivivax sp.]
MSRKLIAVALTTCALVACGGGGGGGGESSGPGIAEGSWIGTSEGDDVSVVVLDDGQVWGLVADGPYAYALFNAPSSSTSGDQFKLNNPRFYEFGAGSPVSGSIGATVTQTTMNGKAVANGQTSTFNLTREAGYNQAVTTAALAGTWTGSVGSLDGVDSITATVSANGTFTAFVGSCTIQGSLVPRGSVAVYTLVAQYQQSSGCPVNYQLKGIAVPGGSNRLLLGAILPDRSDASLVILNK